MTGNEQQKRSEALKEAILDCAFRLGLKDGFDELSVRKITKEMGYSTGVIYHHFKNKQEILDAIVEAETNRLYKSISSLLDETADLVFNMKTVFHHIMGLALEESEKYNLVVLRKYSRPKQELPPWINYLHKELEKGMQEGLFRQINPRHAAFSIWTSFLGFNLMISRYPGLTAKEADQLFTVQFNLILKGVLSHE